MDIAPICNHPFYHAQRELLRIRMSFPLEAEVEGTNRAVSPKLEIASWIIIVVDDVRVNRGKLRPDPRIDHPEIWLYDGIIDLTNAVVVPIDDLL